MATASLEEFALAVGETLLLSQASVTYARVGDETQGVHEVGTGTIFVTSARVLWIQEGAEGALRGSLEFAATSLNLHAISREGNDEFPRPCIYCQLDESQVNYM